MNTLKAKALRRKLITVTVAACFVGDIASANPVGPVVVNGQAAFAHQGNTLSITNTPGAIINWQQFSIGANQSTRFIQQSAASAVLNRVIGANPSSILGTLQSNGRVFLINPNGILFGAGARIDVAGLVASTLNLSNQDFLAGRLNFTATPGAASVVNQGTITTPFGGRIYLIAPYVHNSGIIQSPQGEVILAAGNTVQIVDSGTPNLLVQITAPDNQAVNLGQIIADSGKIGIYAGLIQNSGVIHANGVVVGQNGEILLKATQNTTLAAGSTLSASGAQGGSITVQSGDTTLVSGSIAATGSQGTGGSVQVLGNQVGLLDNSSINASGQTGGGTVLVGGDFHGTNPNVQNATATYVSPTATINADAIQSGNGGSVAVWADNTTRFYGSISATGGAQSGNGGFVETSGHDYLDFQGSVNTTAPMGSTGTLLLDPTNIYIALSQGNATTAGMSGTDSSANTGSGGNPNTFAGAGVMQDSLLTTGNLDTALASANVIVTTTNASGTGAGNITVVDPVAWASANTLTLTAANNIAINAGITTGAAGSALVLNATGNVTQSAAGIIAGAGDLTLNGAGTVTLSQANTYTGGTSINSGILSIQNSGALGTAANTSSTTVASGAVLQMSNNITTTNGGTLILNGTGTGLGALVNVSGDNTWNSSVTLGSNAMIYSAAAGNTLNIGSAAFGTNLFSMGSNTITIAGPGNTWFNSNAGVIGDTGGLVMNSTGLLTLYGNNSFYTGPTTVNAGTLNLVVGPMPSGWYGINGSLTIGTGPANPALAGTVNVTLLSDSYPDEISPTSAVTINSDGAFNARVSTGLGNALTLNGGQVNVANGSTVTVNGNITTNTNSAHQTSLISGGALSLTTGNFSVAQDATLASDLTISSAMGGTNVTKTGSGTLTLSGANTYTGTTSVNAGTLSVTNAGAINAAAGAVTVASGAALNINGVTLDTVAAGLSVQGTGVGATGALTGTGISGYAGPIMLAAATTIGETSAVSTLTLGGMISGAGGLTQAGTGTLVLGAANTYGGNTTITAGSIVNGVANALPTATFLTVTSPGSLNLAGFDQTVAGVTGSGTVMDSGAAATFAVTNAGADTFAGTLTGANLALAMNGSGTLTLSGPNTFGGATSVNTGTLSAANASALGSSANGTTVANGATLQISNVGLGAEAVTLNGAGVGGAGALIGTGAASLAGDVTLNTASTVAVANGADTLILAGAVEGPGALSLIGSGTVTLGGTVGSSTALAALTQSASTTLNINGGLVRTSGNQTYGGAVSTGGANTLRTTAGGSVAASGAFNAAAGTLTLDTGAGDTTLTNSANDFGTVQIASGGTVSIVDANALTLGASSMGTMTAQTLAGNLTLNGALTASGSGDAIVLAAGGNFVNNAGAAALNPGAGRWLVWSTSPALDNRGGLGYNFKQYNAAYGVTSVLGSGNGFLYTLAPTITPALTGTVSKVYDGTTTATLAAGNYSVSGAVDGDSVTLNNPAGGIYATRNVGTGENVSVSGIAIAGATNGAATVYGYQIGSSSANANIGTITARPITISSQSGQGKTYGSDDPAAANTAYSLSAGSLGTGDNLTGNMGRIAGENVGGYAFTQSTLTVNDGNGGNNYGISFNGVTNEFQISALALTGTIANQTKVYGQNDPSLAGIAVNLGGVINRTVSDINGNNTIVNDTGTVTTSLASLTRAAGENVGSYNITTGTLNALSGSAAGNYTASLTTAGDTLAVTAAALVIQADDQSRTQGVPNPPFTESYTGFKFGETPAVLGGMLVYATPATIASPSGQYEITLSGQSSGNYAISYVNGTLTVGAPLPMTNAGGRNDLLSAELAPCTNWAWVISGGCGIAWVQGRLWAREK